MIFLILSSIVWGFSYGLIKKNLVGLSPDLISFIRMVIPFVLFLPFFRLNFLSWKKVCSFVSIGAIQYGVMYLCVIRSYEYLAAYQILLFTACTPIYVSLINDFFLKKFNFFYFLMAIWALLGAALVCYEYFCLHRIFKGFLLVQFADLCFAFGQVAYRRIQESEKSKDHQIYALLFFGASIVTACSTTAFEGWRDLFALTSTQILVLFYLGAIASGLCFFWWNRSSVFVSNSTLAVCNNAKIPLGILFSILFFQEKASFLTVSISLCCIGGAIVCSELYGLKKRGIAQKKVKIDEQTAYF